MTFVHTFRKCDTKDAIVQYCKFYMHKCKRYLQRLGKNARSCNVKIIQVFQELEKC